MSERKLSGVEVLSILVERVRRIESDAKAVAAVLVKMIEKQSRQVEPGQAEGPSDIAAPGAS